MVATGEGGFRQVASLASERNPACPCGVPGKSLILSHNAEAIRGGGFQVASPVKKPRASEMPRCAPPYTDRAREEPCRGGAYAVGLLPSIRTEQALRRGFPRTANQACRSNVGGPKSVVRGEAVIRACCLLATTQSVLQFHCA